MTLFSKHFSTWAVTEKSQIEVKYRLKMGSGDTLACELTVFGLIFRMSRKTLQLALCDTPAVLHSIFITKMTIF